jgi:hypothetical protein
MAGHRLGLSFTETSNENILKIEDMSVYTNLLSVTCPQLLILPPGFTTPTEITPLPGFNTVFTACMLAVQTKNCDAEYSPLPDGIYAIKYSVAPNEYVSVEYNILRTVQWENKWREAICSIEIGCLPEREKNLKLEELMELKRYVDAAKVKVERCHEASKGMLVFNYAVDRLTKEKCKIC